MASGRFGKAALAAGAYVDIYTVPPGYIATANIWLCNRGGAPAKVRVAIRSGAPGAVPADSDFLEYESSIPPGGILECTGVAMTAGEIITVRSDAATVSARAHGFEESV